MNSAIVASEVWRGERALIKNYPKGLSPAMKQVILLLLLPPSHPSTPPLPTFQRLLPGLAAGF